MKVKHTITYICDYCKKEYLSYMEAWECEAKCLGLTAEEYNEYLRLLRNEEEAKLGEEYVSSSKTQKRHNDATNAVIEFQKKHNIKTN